MSDEGESVEDKFIRIILDLTIIGLLGFVYVLWWIYQGSTDGMLSLAIAGVVAITVLGYLLIRYT